MLDLTFLTLLPGRMCSHGHSMLKHAQMLATWAMMTAAPSFTAASTSSRVLT